MNSVGKVELDHRPEKDHIWAAVEVFADELDLEDNRPDHPGRCLWYVPTVTIRDAHRARQLFERYDIETVYDLGAGDCRFALWLDRQGYDVVAYELNAELFEAVRDRFWLGDLDLRCRDYLEDVDADRLGPETALVAFGGTNGLTDTPPAGLAIHGYGETGTKVWYDGEPVAAW